MLDETDPLIRFKLSLLQHGLEVRREAETRRPLDAIVFGDMYAVEGGYAAKCAEYGCEAVLLIDAYETPGWLAFRQAHPTVDFMKGDFSDPLFMLSIQRRFSVGVLFDVLLHQPPLVSTLHLVAEKVSRTLCIVQPMLREQELPNSLVYLPGNAAAADLQPLGAAHGRYKMFDARAVNRTHWIWGMTRSFLRSALAAEGFEVKHTQELDLFPNKAWYYLGCVAERFEENPLHWSKMGPSLGLRTEPFSF
ncbi:MAG: hypothetical protein ACRD2T_01330 [Thermoanaerobaculia bacterium]